MISKDMIKRRLLISLVIGLITIIGMSWYVNTYIYNFFAATARVAVSLQPSVNIVQPNTEFTLGVSAANQPIDALDLYVTYDPTKVEYLNKYTQLPISYFTNEIVAETLTVLGKKQVHLALVSTNPLRQKSVRLNLQFKSLTVAGDADFTVESKSQVTGVDELNNPVQFEKDPAIATGKITVAIPSVPSPSPTNAPGTSVSQWVLTLRPVCTNPNARLLSTFTTNWYWYNNGTGTSARTARGTAQPVIINGPSNTIYNVQLSGITPLAPLTLPAGMTKVANNTVTWSSATLPGSTQTITFAAPETACVTPTPIPTNTVAPTPITCIPTLISPARNSNVTSNPTFEWSACPGTGGKYSLEVTGNATPSTVLFVGTRYSFTNPIPTWVAGRTYSWKVKACPNADCIGGTFSTESQFIYNTVSVPTPTTVNPTAIATIPPTSTPPVVPTVKPKVPPTISNISWTPAVPVSGDPVEGLITGTDTDSTQVTVEVYVSGQNIPETLFAKGDVTVNAGKWTYKASKTLPGFVGTFNVYAVAKDEVNIVKSKIYTVSVLAPTPKDTCPRRFQGDANCDNTVNLLDVVCLRGEIIGQIPKNCVSSDFNNDKKVTIADAPIWRSTYIKENTVQK